MRHPSETDSRPCAASNPIVGRGKHLRLQPRGTGGAQALARPKPLRGRSLGRGRHRIGAPIETSPGGPLLAALASALLATAAATGCAASAPPPEPGLGLAGLVEGSPPETRVAAEWEPALGVLVRWPPYLPRDLFVELARDTRLFVLVEDRARAEDARGWFDRWGIPPERVEFLEVSGSDDAAWTRDFGPHPVFTAGGGFELGDARYDLSTPDSGLACDGPLGTPWNGGWGERFLDYDVRLDDAAPTAIARALGLPSRDLPFVLTGGNFMTDGRGGAMSSCILVNENERGGLDEDRLRQLLARDLGIRRFDVLPNFEDDGIQHVDCLLKLLDEERLLVARPPTDHALFERYERIVTEHLARLRTRSGRPYEILRLDTARYSGERLAAYTNSLVLNSTVYVPLFGIAQDEIALAQWRAALPGHAVKGFPFVLDEEPALPDRARRMYDDGIGWRNFDALHCRTRAVWDPHMLHIAVDRVPRRPAARDSYEVVASIVPYSGARLLADVCRVRWRYEREAGWREEPLVRGEDGRFRTRIPAGPAARTVEYHVVAADASPRYETAPPTAPGALLRFTPTR